MGLNNEGVKWPEKREEGEEVDVEMRLHFINSETVRRLCPSGIWKPCAKVKFLSISYVYNSLPYTIYSQYLQ